MAGPAGRAGAATVVVGSDGEEVVVMKVEREAEVEGTKCGTATMDEVAEGVAAAAVVEEERGEGTAAFGGMEEDAVGDRAAGAELEAEEAGEAEGEGWG